MEFLNNIQLTGDITAPERKVINTGGGAEGIIRPSGKYQLEKVYNFNTYNLEPYTLRSLVRYDHYFIDVQNVFHEGITIVDAENGQNYKEDTTTNLLSTFPNDVIITSTGTIENNCGVCTRFDWYEGMFYLYVLGFTGLERPNSTNHYYLYECNIDINDKPLRFTTNWQRIDVTSFFTINKMEYVQVFPCGNNQICLFNKTQKKMWISNTGGGAPTNRITGWNSAISTSPIDTTGFTNTFNDIFLYKNKMAYLDSYNTLCIGNKELPNASTTFSPCMYFPDLNRYAAQCFDKYSKTFCIYDDYIIFLLDRVYKLNLRDGSVSTLTDSLALRVHSPFVYKGEIYMARNNVSPDPSITVYYEICKLVPEYEILLNLDSGKTIHGSNILTINGNVSYVDSNTYITTAPGEIKILTTKPIRVD